MPKATPTIENTVRAGRRIRLRPAIVAIRRIGTPRFPPGRSTRSAARRSSLRPTRRGGQADERRAIARAGTSASRSDVKRGERRVDVLDANRGAAQDGLAHELAVDEESDAVGEGGVARVVRDEQDRAAVLVGA